MKDLAVLPPPQQAEEGSQDTHDWRRRDVALRHTVAELMQVYRESAEQVCTAYKTLHDAETRLTEHFALGGMDIRIEQQGYGWRPRYDKPEDALKDLERKLWNTLVERLDIRRLMSIKAWKDLEQNLEKEKLPELNEENVFGMLRGFIGRISEMHEEAVEEVFNWLRPPGSEYKTNSEYEVGRKAILSYVVETGWGMTAFQVNHSYEPNLTALENVFMTLDGKGRINKEYYSVLSRSIKEVGKDGRGETAYFKFRCCKNRNLHIEFRRLDLLQRFNQIAGGKRLRKERKA